MEASRSHSDTRGSVGLLCTSDQPDAEICTWQHATLTRERPPNPGGMRTRIPSELAAINTRFRPRGHWDRQGRDIS